MGWESVLGAVAGPVIGGLFGDDTSGAIEQSGADTAAASKYAADRQYKMFQEQQANANLKYGQTRYDLSSLFGGNVGMPTAGTTTAATPTLSYAQLREQLLPQFTTAGTPTATGLSRFSHLSGSREDPFRGTASTVNEAGLQAAIQAALTKQATGVAGATGIPSGGMFGANNGINNPQLQALLQQLRGTAGNQLDLFNKFNPQTMAQDIYGKLTALGQPQRNLDRSNLESRLLNQGILSGTPGGIQLEAQNNAFGQEDLARQIQAMMTAQAQQQQYLSNATGTAGTAGNLESQAYGPALQAAGIAAGVPINSGQPIPTGELGVSGVAAQGAANVQAANVRDSFWNSLINSSGVQGAIKTGVGSLFNGNLGLSGGVPINTSPNLSGAEGLFSLINGYGGGV
jgi:hypothetical protein